MHDCVVVLPARYKEYNCKTISYNIVIILCRYTDKLQSRLSDCKAPTYTYVWRNVKFEYSVNIIRIEYCIQYQTIIANNKYL